MFAALVKLWAGGKDRISLNTKEVLTLQSTHTSKWPVSAMMKQICHEVNPFEDNVCKYECNKT